MGHRQPVLRRRRGIPPHVDRPHRRRYTPAPVGGIRSRDVFHVEQTHNKDMEILATWLGSQGESISGFQVQRIDRYCGLVRSWGARRNLLSRKDLPNLVPLHLCDSLSALPLIPSTLEGRVMDLGSGAGLPGIPLAIMRPSLEFVLLEPRLGRLEFLEAALAALELDGVTAVRAAAGELGGDHRGVYGIVLARAVGKLRELTRMTAPLLSPAGALLAYKGPRYREELHSLSPSTPLRLEDIREVELPLGHGARYLLVFRKS